MNNSNYEYFYDGFNVEKVGNFWVAKHFSTDYGSLSSHTEVGVLQMIEDFWIKGDIYDYEEALEDG